MTVFLLAWLGLLFTLLPELLSLASKGCKFSGVYKEPLTDTYPACIAYHPYQLGVKRSVVQNEGDVTFIVVSLTVIRKCRMFI